MREGVRVHSNGRMVFQCSSLIWQEILLIWQAVSLIQKEVISLLKAGMGGYYSHQRPSVNFGRKI